MAKETQNIHLGLKRQISFHNLQYFHDLKYFHVCAPGLTPCLGHNLFEGIVQHDLALNIKYLIKKSECWSECWRFYAVSTARVIFTAKTSFDVISLSREQVWTFSSLGDRIYEMRCPFVAVGPNARFIVLPHWDNMS